MDLNDLTASELASLDAICLRYEAELRDGSDAAIEDWVARHGEVDSDLLERELIAIRNELSESPQRPSGTTIAAAGLERIVPRPAQEMPETGRQLGHYELGSLIGRGGMGVVYAATDRRLSRTVAIKMLTVAAAARPELTQRFEREAKAVAALSHPHIVELFDIGISDGVPYAVMEYLDGELLDERFARGPMEPMEVRRLGAQIAEALTAAHAGGVIHRDLKPHNVMLIRPRGGQREREQDVAESRRDGEDATIVKLFDFGLSRVPRAQLESSDETAEGIILGTPGYMAPEQARGESVTPAADIFSFGCLLFEAFYGRRAFDGDTSVARFKATIDDTPSPDPIRRRQDVGLAKLIDECLQKDPQSRPPSAREVARRLRQDLAQEVEPNRMRLSRRHWVEIGAGVLAGAVAWMIFGRQREGIGQVSSLAVLSFDDVTNSTGNADSSHEGGGQPVGQRDLTAGEKLAALLVHELTRLSELRVPRFRPITAQTPREFREIGKELEVDALLTGTTRIVQQGSVEFMEVDIQLISSATGNQMWGKQIQTDAADNYLHQSKLATEIASAIGHRLTSTAEELAPPSVESFSCLVDGETRSDPESVAGLEKALMCFENAHRVDRRFAAPLAGIALTSITLAAQSSAEKSLDLIVQARKAAADALALDHKSTEARLAEAMLDWQTTNRYERAEQNLRELTVVSPNHWQVKREYGMLLLVIGRPREAAVAFREASQLNPWSVMAKIDRARATWFSGNATRAIEDAIRIADKYDGNILARGLLVDIYESQQRYDLAAAQHQQWPTAAGFSEQDYLPAREQQLSSLPYGPFGETMNRAIWQARTQSGINELQLAEIAESTPPMLPLLLAVHPSFRATRLLHRAKEILPD